MKWACTCARLVSYAVACHIIGLFLSQVPKLGQQITLEGQRGGHAPWDLELDASSSPCMSLHLPLNLGPRQHRHVADNSILDVGVFFLPHTNSFPLSPILPPWNYPPPTNKSLTNICGPSAPALAPETSSSPPRTPFDLASPTLTAATFRSYSRLLVAAPLKYKRLAPLRAVKCQTSCYQGTSPSTFARAHRPPLQTAFGPVTSRFLNIPST